MENFCLLLIQFLDQKISSSIVGKHEWMNTYVVFEYHVSRASYNKNGK